MAGTKELPKTTGRSLKELSARTTLNQVRSEGHPYVDLREDGNAFIFFCTICLAPCYNDNTLYDHLGGKLHARRYAAVKVTLLGPNPFPFSDGALFFHGPAEQDNLLCNMSTKSNQPPHTLLSIGFKNSDNDKSSNSVNEGREVLEWQEPRRKSNSLECVVRDRVDDTSDSNEYMVVPNVVCNDQLSDLKIKFIGFGEIAARICEKDGNRSIRTIWCEWLGENSGHGNNVPDNDFAIINFSYNYTLGRAGITEESHARLTSGAYSGNVNKKKRKSFSDPEDVSKSLRRTRVSGGRDCAGEQNQNVKVKLSRTARQALRKQQQIVSNCMCDICQQKILPGKDVSTLLNMRTMRLACSSRNRNGAFHVFHTSCLIHWILLCEYEVWTNQFGSQNMAVGSQGVTNGSQGDGRDKVVELSIVPKTPLSSVFCTECQGRGINVEENLENPSVFLSEMFKFKIKLLDGHKAWMFKGPEVLKNCSTGLRFSDQYNEAVQGNVTPLKMMYFFRADL
ncbi:hypothetical protein MKW92_012002 [Papaver armeniacum]|nr:hypothetical protein MKW92_012002 [Papaver armeniacum]